MIRAGLAAAVAALSLAVAGEGRAQSPAGVEQLRSPIAPAERARADQVSPDQSRAGQGRANEGPQLSLRSAGKEATPQVTGAKEGGKTPGQVASVGAGRQPTTQLAQGARTAEGPAPLSTPRDGRNPRIDAVQGADRCDPKAAQRLSPEDRARCERVIERRSAEFDRPAPRELSPEERLMQVHDEPLTADARSAARLLGAGEVDDSQSAQAIAAASNRTLDARSDGGAGPPDLTPETQAVIQAIVQGAGAVSVR